MASLKEAVRQTVDRVRDALSPDRDALVARVEELRAEYASEAEKWARAVAEKQAIVDELERPHRELAQAQAAQAAAGNRLQKAINLAERELRESPSRELARFAVLLERVFERQRRTPPPSPREEHNPITLSRRTVNLPEIEKHLAVAPVLARLRIELRDTLWRLPDDELRERLAAHRRELEAVLAGTALADEV